MVAGLPPHYGLYSAFMGCFVYCLFGSAKAAVNLNPDGTGRLAVWLVVGRFE